MKVAIGTDHAGLKLKPLVIEFLKRKNFEYKDFGTTNLSSCDYPDYALPVAESVASGEYDRGILICGTGVGISIAANKVPKIRCAICHDYFSTKYTRLHNDANIIAFGERVIGGGLMLELLEVFFSTEFEGGRHQNRINKITDIEKKFLKYD